VSFTVTSKQLYPSTANSSTHLSSNNPYKRQNSMNPARRQQGQHQPYPARYPPGSTTTLLQPRRPSEPRAGPSKSNVQATFSRGPKTSNPPSLNTYQDVSLSFASARFDSIDIFARLTSLVLALQHTHYFPIIPLQKRSIPSSFSIACLTLRTVQSFTGPFILFNA
jgi:hypothetical protein